MRYEVKVRQPLPALDLDVVSRAFGEAALDVRTSSYVASPYITVNGRINPATSYYLLSHCRSSPHLGTANRIASDLRHWVSFLVNERNLLPFADDRDPVLAATEDDFAAFYRRCQYPESAAPGAGRDPAGGAMTSDSWRDVRSAAKRLYEHLGRRYQHPKPFEVAHVVHQSTGRRSTTIVGYRPRRRATGSRGTPIDPYFVQVLLQAALRIDADGRQHLYVGADRDQAILALGLATGTRRNNLSNITKYEVPRCVNRDFTVTRVADFITKGDAGGDSFVFAHHLPAVWDYLEGRRAELTAGAGPYAPDQPLHIESADEVRVTYSDPAHPEAGTQTRTWVVSDETFRRRLVDVDGSSPVLFLNEYTADPLSYDSLSNIIESARKFAAKRIDPAFPQAFRLHDLRHTYAVHLLLAIYHGTIARNLPKHRREDYTVDHLSAALELVKASLGHASEDSTKLYLATAHRFLGIAANEFVGAR